MVDLGVAGLGLRVLVVVVVEEEVVVVVVVVVVLVLLGRALGRGAGVDVGALVCSVVLSGGSCPRADGFSEFGSLFVSLVEPPAAAAAPGAAPAGPNTPADAPAGPGAPAAAPAGPTPSATAAPAAGGEGSGSCNTY